jgi:putative toxin-antitoxin system antitoxin component (TIGR02293 family)
MDRKKKLSAMPKSKGALMADQEQLLRRAIVVFCDRSSAELWLLEPALALDGRRPIDLLSTPVGINAVIQLLGRIQHGVYT